MSVQDLQTAWQHGKKESAILAAVRNLRELIYPGAAIYGLRVYTSPKGGMARFSVMVVVKDGTIRNITTDVARATGVKLRQDGFLVTHDLNNVLLSLSRKLNYAASPGSPDYMIFRLNGLN